MMRSAKIISLATLMVLFLLGTVSAQQKKGKKGGQTGKRIEEMTIVISGVDEATIEYLSESRGRMATNYIGIASITRIMKNGKEAAIKDLEKADKAVVTLYKDPDDPYFPALAVNVIGKGELPQPRKKGKKKKS